MLYIFTKFHKKIFQEFKSYKVDMISILKFTKGHYSIKNVGRALVLYVCSSSNDTLYLYKVSLSYLKGFQSYLAYTISISKFSKGHNSVKK